ncbi:MAG: RagB/SusD family nutrient uptake outer membrane protein [Prevotella sp.]|nr:RagB/SusD family nutrient uptake outer membrane protein [Prevotella sp.]
MKKYILMISAICVICGFTACSDFLDQESDQVIYADKSHLDNATDTLWSVAGILNKMQVIADRTILLGEMRGDLVDINSNTSSDLRDVALFNIGDDNMYNSPRDYYAIINNCNYFIAKADTALRNNRNEYIFMKEYAAVKAFRAWTYLQLALNYGQVPLVTDPILSKAESEMDYPKYGIAEICDYFIDDIAPYADVETPGYGTIRNTDSKLFYFPIYVLLGDLNLWAGHYKEAALNYYKYLSTHNGTNTASPISTGSVRFMDGTHWQDVRDGWSMSSFIGENHLTYPELITMIPGDSIPSEGNYSELRNLFNAYESNEYKASIVPSQRIIELSSAQKYCHVTASGEVTYAPEGLDEYRSGDLRFQSIYKVNENRMVGTHRVTEIGITKYSTRNVHVYRLAMVYLRMAEALNRAGYPRFAFQILKTGVNNEVIENDVIPYYRNDSTWIRQFDFPNTLYILETTANSNNENTIGIHSRGSGYSSFNDYYVMPEDTLITDSLQQIAYQIEQVEDLIVNEEALEFAFEGQRFYDLMRVALRRNDPSFLANRIYARRGGENDATMHSLIQVDLNDTRSWYLNWQDKIGLGY